MGERDDHGVLSWLLESWTARLADSLEGLTGERPTVTWRAAGAAPSTAPGLLWWEQPLSLGGQALVWVGAPDPQDARNTYLEALNQACAGLAQAISQRLGREITSGTGREAAPPASGALAFEIEVAAGGKSLRSLQFACPSALMDLLRTGVAAASPQNAPNTLDLLMEVELPVSISFGRAQLALQDVLKLNTGSIVELNRAVSEPVEIVVNNCVIARGEVVVVEGNYGVRIQEIVSRDKRLRTLE